MSEEQAEHRQWVLRIDGRHQRAGSGTALVRNCVTVEKCRDEVRLLGGDGVGQHRRAVRQHGVDVRRRRQVPERGDAVHLGGGIQVHERRAQGIRGRWDRAPLHELRQGVLICSNAGTGTNRVAATYRTARPV